MNNDLKICRPIVRNERTVAYMIFCPGCKCGHGVAIDKSFYPSGSVWSFNGDVEKPTFEPSLLVDYGPSPPADRPARCHSYVRNGQIQFLGDCTHDLAGKTVDLQPF